MSKSRIVSVLFITFCAIAAAIPACVATDSSVTSEGRAAYDLGSGSGGGDTCAPEYASSTGGGSGSGGSGSGEPTTMPDPVPGPGSDFGSGAARMAGGVAAPANGEVLETLDDGTVVFAGGPAANEAVCAGACGARGCGAYTWNGNITTGCKCYLNGGWKWFCSSSPARSRRARRATRPRSPPAARCAPHRPARRAQITSG